VAFETTKQEEERRKKPKPEEQEGMPQHQNRPTAERMQSKASTALLQSVVFVFLYREI
jgi:hypothetical protein